MALSAILASPSSALHSPTVGERRRDSVGRPADDESADSFQSELLSADRSETTARAESAEGAEAKDELPRPIEDRKKPADEDDAEDAVSEDAARRSAEAAADAATPPPGFSPSQATTFAAPLTTAIGILTAYLISRQSFAGKGAFEFGTMLSFAIPGTVVGVSYVAAFNVPPVDITGTMAILIICFMFRNMPVGMRAGIAALSQIDRSMEEASQTLGANGFTMLRTIVLPLIRPAVFTAMVYAFVTAMTAVSAVIFLVSARHNMATAYIMGRVENGEFALAIAYSAVLMIIMIVSIVLIQFLVGKRQLGRRAELQRAAAPLAAE